MQDAASSPGTLEQPGRTSALSPAEHEPISKPTTATTTKRKTTSRQPSFRPDLTVPPRTAIRKDKTFIYAAPASDRESWWRVTIKV